MSKPYHTQSINDYTFRLRYIPETTFAMGSNNTKDAFRRESPVHQVKLSPYYIGEFLVTNALWKAVTGEFNEHSAFSGDKRPVECVSWNDITEPGGFLDRINEQTEGERPEGFKFRLPTEAEWECAARAGRDFEYAGSNKLKEVAWFVKNSHEETKEIGLKKPNNFGLYDMSGNVYEWCHDYLSEDFYQKCANQAAESGLGYVENPCCYQGWQLRVLRGGSWNNVPRGCRVSYRLNFLLTNRFNYVGFRLVLSSFSLAGS